MKKSLSLTKLTIIWTIIYFVYLKLIFTFFDTSLNSFLYFGSIFSYSLIGILIVLLVKTEKKKLKLYTFLTPFIFGLLLAIVFITGMALVESYYAGTVFQKFIRSIQLLPYSLSKGVLVAIPMGLLGYLFGGLTSILKK